MNLTWFGLSRKIREHEERNSVLQPE